MSKAQMSYVHIMGPMASVSLQFSRKQVCGYSTFVLQTINMQCLKYYSCCRSHRYCL